MLADIADGTGNRCKGSYLLSMNTRALLHLFDRDRDGAIGESLTKAAPPRPRPLPACARPLRFTLHPRLIQTPRMFLICASIPTNAANGLAAARLRFLTYSYLPSLTISYQHRAGRLCSRETLIVESWGWCCSTSLRFVLEAKLFLLLETAS